jgi:hypothetical protein
MNSFTKEIICDTCVKPFIPQSATNTTCVQCMIKPSKPIASIAQPSVKPITKGEHMAQQCKEKACVNCGKQYMPTSNVQKRCPACMANKPKAAKVAHPFGANITKKVIGKKQSSETKQPGGDLLTLAETLLSCSGGQQAEIIIGGIKIRFARV